MSDGFPRILRQQASSAPEMMAECEENEWKLIHIMVAICKEKHVLQDEISHQTFNVTYSDECLAIRRALRRKPTPDGYYAIFNMPSLYPKANDHVALTGIRKGPGLLVKEWHLCEQAERDYWILRNTRDRMRRSGIVSRSRDWEQQQGLTHDAPADAPNKDGNF